MLNEQIQLWGNIGSVEKCQRRPVQGEPTTYYVKFTVAVDRKQLGSNEKETTWYTVIMNGNQVNANPDAVVALYAKGKRVAVAGRLEISAAPSTRNPGQIYIERTIYPVTRPSLM